MGKFLSAMFGVALFATPALAQDKCNIWVDVQPEALLPVLDIGQTVRNSEFYGASPDLYGKIAMKFNNCQDLEVHILPPDHTNYWFGH